MLPSASSGPPPVPVTAWQWRTYTRSEAAVALGAWHDLEQRLGNQGYANSTAWVDCWLQHYGEQIPHHFLAAYHGEQLRGIVLLTTGIQQKMGPFAVRTVHLGTAGEPLGQSVVVEYNRPLIEPGYEQEFVRGVLAHLRLDLSWEQIRLDGLSPQDLAVWQAQLPGSEVRRRECRYFDFTQAAGKEVLSALGSSTRSNIRRRLKKYTQIQTDWATQPQEAVSLFEELITLHQARWQAVGQPGAFASPNFLGFQRDVALRLLHEQRGVLFRLRDGSTTLGCLFLLVDEGRLLDYLSGFASFEEHPSIGLVTHALCMEEARKKGYRAYDFLVGDKQHKQNLSNAGTELCWLTWTRPSWKASCLTGLRSAKRLWQGWRRPASPPASVVEPGAP